MFWAPNLPRLSQEGPTRGILGPSAAILGVSWASNLLVEASWAANLLEDPYELKSPIGFGFL